VVILAVVVFGFLLRPQREVFYLRTKVSVPDPGYFAMEHDRIAVRVELARLWLLFVPTFAAVGFLLITFARGTTWHFSLWNSPPVEKYVDIGGPYPIFLFCRILVALVIGLLSTWLSERWVIRDAEACNADSISAMAGRILYSFKNRSGEYYGGEGFPCAPMRSRQLATIVLYNVSKPQLNKLSMCCLFHRLVVIGRGVTDLDEATVIAHSPAAAASQPL